MSTRTITAVVENIRAVSWRTVTLYTFLGEYRLEHVDEYFMRNCGFQDHSEVL